MKKIGILLTVILLGITLESYAQSLSKQLSRGLIAHYKMDANGEDASGNHNDGYLNGGITPVKDRFGNDCSALDFNGYNSYIQVPDSKTLSSIREALTVSTWFKLGYGNEYAGVKWLTTVCKSNMGKECDESPHFRMQATSVTVSLNTEFTEETRQNWNYDQWYHYTMTYDGRFVRSYLDGRLVFEYPFSGELQPNAMPMEIGRDIPGNMEYFVGVLDDLRIYDRALADNEIQELFLDESDKNKSYNPCSNKPPKKNTPPQRTKPEPEPERTQPQPPVVTIPAPQPQPTPSIDPQPEEEPAYEGTYPNNAGISDNGNWVPSTLGGDTVVYQNVIKVKSPDILIYPFDHQKEDGDTVSINVNGVWIVDQYELKNRSKDTKAFRLSLQPGKENYLISKAWNLGSIPPNTLTLEIRDGVNRPYQIPVESVVGKSGAIKIIYEPD